MRLGRLITRVVIGGLFVGHGTQKLFGWFNGPGIEGVSGMMDSLELKPGKRNAVAAGATEAGSGALLALGALTPLAATGIIATMITAIRKVHGANGPWITQQGYEYNLVLIVAVLAIVDGGPGPLSVDGALGLDDTGPGWALAALAAGAVGSTLVIEAGKRGGTDETQPTEAPPESVREGAEIRDAETAEA